MFKQLFGWLFGVKEEQPVQGDIYQTILDKIGVNDDLTNINFIPSRSRSVSLMVTTSSLLELQEALIQGSLVAAAQGYIPAKWKGKYTNRELRPLDAYITDADELIHPLDWIESHRHYIIKLIDSILKMDQSEREYYHRSINFIIEDILSLLEASKGCVR
ncbi:hypothetical protein D3C85_13760 [compost metagenome]